MFTQQLYFSSMNEQYDYIVIGSGFGGSVSAMRLAEKGYSVLVIEKGKRWAKEDFPKTDWNLPKYLWMPIERRARSISSRENSCVSHGCLLNLFLGILLEIWSLMLLIMINIELMSA